MWRPPNIPQDKAIKTKSYYRNPECAGIVVSFSKVSELLKDLDREIFDNKDTKVFTRVHELELEIETTLDSIEDRLNISITEVKELMRGKFIGPDDINIAFGFMPENIPPIPFDRETLELHEKLGHYLVYEATKTKENEPLTFEKMAILAGSNIITKSDGMESYRLHNNQFDSNGRILSDAWFSKAEFASVRNEVPDGGWKLVSLEIIQGSLELKYLERTDFLIDYWKKNILNNDLSQMPEIYEDAINQWKNDKPSIQKLIDVGNNIEASNRLSVHPISQLLQESFASIAYRYIILEKSQKLRILSTERAMSKTPACDGGMIHFGSGGFINRDYPEFTWMNIGSVFVCKK